MSAPSGTPTARRAFCSAVSGAGGEPLAATASRVDHWILVEYRARWTHDPLEGSVLSPALKEHLRAQAASLPRSRLLLVKQPARRDPTGNRVFIGSSRPGEERFFQLEVERHDDLLRLDLAGALADGRPVPGAEPVEAPLYVVCTHGKRDRCCALYGRPLYDALRHEMDPGRVWQSTHIGGDRFAGNVVVLPLGLYYGRVAAVDVGRLVATTAAGDVDLDRYRGRSAYSFPVQAAEHALRESQGLLGIGELTLLGAERLPDAARRVRFRTPDSAVHELDVVETIADEATYLTCESAEPRRARRWLVSAHRVVSR